MTALAVFAAKCGTAVGIIANAEIPTVGISDTFNSYAVLPEYHNNTM